MLMNQNSQRKSHAVILHRNKLLAMVPDAAEDSSTPTSCPGCALQTNHWYCIQGAIIAAFFKIFALSMFQCIEAEQACLDISILCSVRTDEPQLSACVDIPATAQSCCSRYAERNKLVSTISLT